IRSLQPAFRKIVSSLTDSDGATASLWVLEAWQVPDFLQSPLGSTGTALSRLAVTRLIISRSIRDRRRLNHVFSSRFTFLIYLHLSPIKTPIKPPVLALSGARSKRSRIQQPSSQPFIS